MMKLHRLVANTALLLACITELVAQNADTTWVQTFTWEEQNNPNTAYDSPGRKWFQFPASDNGQQYRKILMYHNLKCFEQGTAGNLGYPCGEWDYLTYNFLFQHTGAMDSTLAGHPYYKVNNADFTSTNLHHSMAFDTYQSTQSRKVQEGYYSGEFVDAGDADFYNLSPFGNDYCARVQYLYRADELAAAGLAPGDDISRLGMWFTGESGVFKWLTIKVKATTQNELLTPEFTGWQTVYRYHTSIPASENDYVFEFNTPFTWNGTSNLLFEFSYCDAESNYLNDAGIETNMAQPVPAIGGQVSYQARLRSSLTDRYIKFDWNDIIVVPAAAFENVSEQITISFWLNGDPDAQPQDGTCFEGVNAQNQRVLNTHIPWSNGRVYWDAGWDGGYDRIDKAALAQNYEGQWNHWAFTKNTATGSMKIYLNGVLWHQGTNLDNLMSGIVKFHIGGAAGWSNYYNGSMDEFAVWNTELDAATIAQWMYRDIDPAHPAWNQLQVYYHFNEVDGQAIMDASGNGHHAYMLGNATHVQFNGEQLFRNFEAGTWRPAMRLYTDVPGTITETQTVTDHLPVPMVSVAQYNIENYEPHVAAVEYAWEATHTSTYLDDVLQYEQSLNTDEVLVNNTLTYYQAPFEIVNRYELGRYITPYGIQLTLGPDGWTWIYDVTDFAPLLRDMVELEAGNWQELLNLRFAFIHGTPPREVKRVENFWNGNYGLSNMDQYVTNKSFSLNNNEQMLKLRTVATGHGFGSGNNCAEFCYNTHSLKVNGNTQWNWQIMHDCADNPLYPQGGTWVYARAGWCPGKEGKLEEFELTPFLNNQTVSVDYDIQSDPYGNYVFESQMVTYGPIAHQVDAEIDRILAPSNFKLHSRWNPMCDNPVIRLRNQGQQPLTSCLIEYGIVGGNTDSYIWSGNLGFDEYEDVVLQSTNPELWQGNSSEVNVFFAQITHVNGMFTDNYTDNNYATSTFVRPPTYSYGTGENDDNRLIVLVKTNNAYWETEAKLYDINDNLIFQRTYPAPNVTYRDTLQLNAGCYMFLLTDSGDDGLSFFANNDGNGACRLDRVQGLDFEVFNANFGKEIRHYFNWQTDLVSVAENKLPQLTLSAWPNPASDIIQIKLSGFDASYTMRITDMNGKAVKEIRVNTLGQQVQYISLSDLAPGMYALTCDDGLQHQTIRIVKQ